jgi:predicted DNA-binding transcriptional regulator YafY
VASALSTGRVLRLAYRDRGGDLTRRDVEPLGYVGSPTHWYLLGWCRLRAGVRAFRVDRIVSVSVTAETPAPRSLVREDLNIPEGVVTGLDLG